MTSDRPHGLFPIHAITLFLAGLLLIAVKPASSASDTILTVGNSLIRRVFVQKSQEVFTTSFVSTNKVRVTSSGFQLVCVEGNREIIVDRSGSSLKGTVVSPSRLALVLKWTSTVLPLEIDVHYRADKSQPYLFKWLDVTNLGTQPIRVLRATVESLRVARSDEPIRGGVGQPVFVSNQFFLGVEDPAAADQVLGQNVRLSQYPEVLIAPNAGWKSARSVVGAVYGSDESIEDAFRQYLTTLSGRTAVYRPIYCDWASHDELGTLVKPQLTQKLTDSMLDVLRSMKAQYGIQFQYYLIDAFWFAPQGGYTTFKKPNWPRGFEPGEKRILALGMTPGLWFDIGCVPHSHRHSLFIDLKDTPGWSGPDAPCLSDLVFSKFLEHGMAYQIRMNHIGLLKLDFANMLCRHDEPQVSSLGILEKNADSLLNLIHKVRTLDPSVVIRAYNGYSSGVLMDSTEYYDQAYAVSPWWLMWFDSVYSGDPRPADLPSFTNLRDSIIWYQDQQVRNYMRSLMPPFTIDDSGTLVGKTSTVYYIGSQGFTDSWIVNIMRGNLAPELYGDLQLLTKNDLRFIAATLGLLRTHPAIFAKTRPILGIPGRGEVYGYLAAGPDLAFVTVVNPGLFPQSFQVPPPALPSGSMKNLLFTNDGEHHEPIERLGGEIRGILVPGEIRVYALGPQEEIASLSLPAAPTRKYHHVRSFPNPFAAKRDADIKLVPRDAGKTLAIVIQYRKNAQPDRSYAWPENVMKISGSIDSHPAIFSSIPAKGTDIWSKCSWAVFEHPVSASELNHTLHLTLVGSPPAGTQWRIQTFWLN